MRRECRLPAEAASVPAARRFVTEAMAGHPQDVVAKVELMVSELATNCVTHADTSFTISLTTAGRALRVDVHDDGTGRPAVAFPAPSEPHGRGLYLVDQLSTSWGVSSSRRRPGKTLWFVLLTSDARPGGARRTA